VGGNHQVAVSNPRNHTFNNKGETRVYNIINPQSLSISSSESVLVYQYSGVGNHLSMTLLPPVDKCSGSDQVAIHRLTSDDFYMMVFVPNGSQNQFSSNISPSPSKNSDKLSAGSTLELTNSQSTFYAYVLHGNSSDGAVFGSSSPFFEGLSIVEMFYF